MARRYYGLNRGDTSMTEIVDASSSPSKDVEVNFDLAVSLTQEEVLTLLEEIEIKIASGIWPPA